MALISQVARERIEVVRVQDDRAIAEVRAHNALIIVGIGSNIGIEDREVSPTRLVEDVAKHPHRLAEPEAPLF
jgi:hypothetical protein